MQTSGSIEGLLAGHRLLVGPRLDDEPTGMDIVSSSATTRQSTFLIRGAPPSLGTHWQVLEPSLEEIVLGYLSNPDVGEGMADAATTGAGRAGPA